MAQLSGRPLLGTAADRQLAAGRRRELGAVVSAITGDYNVLIVGEPGAGATTALHLVSSHIRRVIGRQARFVNATEIDGIDALLGQVAGDLAPTVSVVGGTSTYARFSRYAELPERIVALVDNFPAALAEECFGIHRDELWSVPITWVVTCAEAERARYLTPPADSFFDVVTELAPLTDVEAATLLRRRTSKFELTPAALRAAVAAGRGNPRRLINAARVAALDGGSPDRIEQIAVARDAAVRRMSRPAAMLLRELESLGPSSASDPSLQERMGWTRPRLVQVFEELLSHDAVTVDEVRQTGMGRPRKLYRSRFVR